MFRAYRLAAFIFLFFEAVTAAFLFNVYEKSQKDYAAEYGVSLQTAYRSIITMYRLATDGYYYDFLNNHDVLSMLRDAQSASDDSINTIRGNVYAKLYPLYERLKRDNLSQLQIHLPDNRSFLRFEGIEKFGDQLTDVRKTIERCNLEQRQTQGFEVGKVVAAFRNVYPIVWNGMHLGSIEFSLSFDAIKDELEKIDTNRYYGMLLKKDVIETTVFHEYRYRYLNSPVSSAYLMEDPKISFAIRKLTESPVVLRLNEAIKSNRDVEKNMLEANDFSVPVSDDNGFYVISFGSIRDSENQPVGYIISYANAPGLANVRQTFVLQLIGSTVLIAFACFILWRFLMTHAEITTEKARLQNIIDEMDEALYVIDTSGLCLYVNKAAYKLLGYAKEELTGANIHNLVHAHSCNNYMAMEKCPVLNALSQKKSIHVEEEFLHKQGHKIAIDLSSRIIYEKKQAIGAVVIFHDITERNALLDYYVQEWTSSETRYKMLFEMSNDAILILRDGLIIDCNSKAQDVFRCSKAILIGARFIDDFSSSVQENSAVSASWCMMLKNALHGQTQTFEWQCVRKDGSIFDAEISLNPIRLQDELLFHLMLRDITRKKQLDKQLAQVQKMQAIGTLAGGIAHDFNNILTAIYGYTEIAKSDAGNAAKIADLMQKISCAANRARDLVKQILTFSRKREAEIMPVMIAPVVKEALKFLAASLPSSIEIVQSIQTNAIVMADPTQLHQIVMNLCTNAAHAMRETNGGILTVILKDTQVNTDLAAELSVTEGDYVRLSIADTGSGIDPAILDRIFEPFFTTKKDGEGTGLGLSITHGIVKQYGGGIAVRSKVGSGSKFEIYLPVAIEETVMSVDTEDNTIKIKENIKMLFVDDEESIGSTVQMLFQDNGFDVTICTDPSQALEYFQGHKDDFDIVVTDMNMPGLSGLELATRITRLRQDIPVILCSGYLETEQEAMLAGYGVRDFVHKPFTKKELMDKISLVLGY